MICRQQVFSYTFLCFSAPTRLEKGKARSICTRAELYATAIDNVKAGESIYRVVFEPRDMSPRTPL